VLVQQTGQETKHGIRDVTSTHGSELEKSTSYLRAELKKLRGQLETLFHVNWIHGQRAIRLLYTCILEIEIVKNNSNE